MNDDIVIDWPAATLIAHRDLCLDCVEIYDLHLTFDLSQSTTTITVSEWHTPSQQSDISNMPSLSDVPVEIFIDNIFPLLPVRDLLRFGATNRAFYLLTSDETFWKRKLEAEFNFPGSDTARITGWKFIYRRLSNPKVYVWGYVSNDIVYG